MSVDGIVKLTRHECDLDDDGHDAAEHVTYDPSASGLTATDVQAAIDEIVATGGAAALDDLTDVVISSPAGADRLRFDGSVWRNSSDVWEPMIASDGSVMTDGLLNPMQHEVPY